MPQLLRYFLEVSDEDTVCGNFDIVCGTNLLDEDIVCGNLTCSSSDHLAQFLIYTNETLSDQELKKDVRIKHFKNLDKRKSKEEHENIDWNQLIAI